MALTENYRINSQMAAMEAALGRILTLAQSTGNKEIAREAKSVLDFCLACTSADSDDEIATLVSQRDA